MVVKNKKLKPLLPVLKEKKRYLAFEIISKGKIKTFSSVASALWDSALAYAGIKGAAHMGLRFFSEQYNPTTQRGLVRVTHTGVNDLKSSLVLTTHINNEPVIVRSIGTSGILAKAKTKYLA